LLVLLATRRLLSSDADGSAVGAGGIGAASSAGAAVVVAGASVEVPAQPHEGAAAAQLLHVLQVLHELQLLPQRLWQWLKQ
jgi:hypothetical protein